MLGKVKVQEIRIKRLYGIQIDEYTYNNVERITFDTQYREKTKKEEPVFVIVTKDLDKNGYGKKETATFWCENTQIIMEDI